MKPIPGCSEVAKYIQNLMLSIAAEVASLVWVMALLCWRSIGIFPQWMQLIHCFNLLLPCMPGEWYLCISRKWWAYIFQWKDLFWIFCFCEKCGDDNQVTGFSLWCAQIPSAVTVLYRDHYHHFYRKGVIIDMSPVVLFWFWAQADMVPTAHIFHNPNLEQSHCHKLNQCLTFQLWLSK